MQNRAEQTLIRPPVIAAAAKKQVLAPSHGDVEIVPTIGVDVDNSQSGMLGGRDGKEPAIFVTGRQPSSMPWIVMTCRELPML